MKFSLHLDSAANPDENNEEEGKYLELEPELLLLPRDMAKTYGELFRYKMEHDKNPTHASVSPTTTSLSDSYASNFCVMVLKPVSWNISSPSARRILFLNVSDRPYEGQPVYLVASPFVQVSSKIYKNVVHVSHISKVASCTSKKRIAGTKRDYIFLIHNMQKDGEEGAPIFNQYYEAIGLILGSIAPYKEDSIGFSVCLGISCILDLLLKVSSYQSGQEIQNLRVSAFRPFLRKPAIKHIASRIVKVITSSNIGSGILLSSKGYILTNRHVIKGHENIAIEISLEGQEEPEYHSVSVFIVAKGDLDIALLKINDNLSDKAIQMLKATSRFLDHPNNVRYLHGNEVYAIGYTFSDMSNVGLRTLSTKGCLSKVIIYQNVPFLILTTCPVYNGFSGGAIVSSRGEFLGLITYNFTHSKRGILNDMNFSYCCNVFKELFDTLDDKNEESIKQLEIWSLEDSYMKRMAISQTVEYVPKFEVESKL